MIRQSSFLPLLLWSSLLLVRPAVGGEPAVPSWEPLFNGHDLAGWVAMNDGVFTAGEGEIHLLKGMGWLRTERTYTNFIFEAEWRALGTNYNSGFFLRAGLEGKPFPTDVWQVNLKESALGSLLKGSKTVLASATAPIPIRQWVKFRMELRGQRLTLDVDGKRAWEFNDFEAEAGYLGLQAEGKSFDFRQLRVQILP